MQKESGDNMQKGILSLSVGILLSFSSMVQAQDKQKICVFDLLGKAGESYKFMEEWALSSKTWGQMSAYFLIKMKQRLCCTNLALDAYLVISFQNE